jgi:copper homeostasis protein (lipoprotein)
MRTSRRFPPKALTPGLLLPLLLAAACGPEEEGSADPAAEVRTPAGAPEGPAASFQVPEAPAAWQGDLPCADCEGIRTTLLLAPDGRFTMEEVYRGVSAERAASGDTVWATRGRWTLEEGGARMRLDGGADGPTYFRGSSGGSLRALDRSGGELASQANHELQRLDAPPALQGTLRELGHFTYFADAALFVPCASGFQTTVAMEGEYLGLERRYLDWAAEGSGSPGAPMPVRLSGRVEDRPAMEGDGTQAAFVVVEWAEADPAPECPAHASLEALAGGEWQLVALDGDPVTLPPESEGPADTPSLAWDRAEGMLSGSGGCNRFRGPGVLRGTELVGQAPMASTLRYCDGVMDVELRFLEILSEGGHFRRDPGVLRFFHGPREVARFEES